MASDSPMKANPMTHTSINALVRSPRRLLALAILPVAATSLALFAGGCKVANTALRADFVDFNSIIQGNQTQQMLLNLVRMHYRETPLFMQAGALTASYESSIGGLESAVADGPAHLVCRVGDERGVRGCEFGRRAVVATGNNDRRCAVGEERVGDKLVKPRRLMKVRRWNLRAANEHDCRGIGQHRVARGGERVHRGVAAHETDVEALNGARKSKRCDQVRVDTWRFKAGARCGDDVGHFAWRDRRASERLRFLFRLVRIV